MDKLVFVIFFAACIAVSSGVEQSIETNYEISRNRIGGNGGGGYNYPGNGYYPGGQYQGGYYPGSGYPGSGYPGSGYPGSGYNPRPPGPPGAHPGCPLCDSSVYDYCSYKEAHDACCCGGGGGAYGYGGGYGCRKADCRTLYANSCEESQLISRCCCVDLQKNSIAGPIPVAIV